MLEMFAKRLLIALTLLTTVFMLNQTESRAWWSCMYPQEGLQQAVCAQVDESGQRKEKDKMTEEDKKDIKITSQFKVKFYLHRR